MNPKTQSIFIHLFIAVLILLIIWFVGGALYNSELQMSISASNFQEVLVFVEALFVIVYVAFLRFHGRGKLQTPKQGLKDIGISCTAKDIGIPEVQGTQKLGLEPKNNPVLPSANQYTETISSMPLSSEPEPTHDNPESFTRRFEDYEEKEDNHSEPKQTKESMVESVDLARLALQKAVYQKLEEQVRKGEITIKAAQDILAADGPKEAPATLEFKPETSIVKVEPKKEEKQIKSAPLR